MRKALALSILLSSSATLVVPAFARETTNTTYVAAGNAYPFLEFGQNGSKKPVIQGGHTWSTDKVPVFDSALVDLWKSVGKTDKYHGTKELDFLACGIKKIGIVVTKECAAYYFFDKKLSPNALGVYFDAEIPFNIGEYKLGPFIRLTHYRFEERGGKTNLTRPGLRLNGPVPIVEKVTFTTEVSVSQNKTADVDTTSFEGEVNWDVGQPSGVVWGTRLKLAESSVSGDKVKPGIFLNVSYTH